MFNQRDQDRVNGHTMAERYLERDRVDKYRVVPMKNTMSEDLRSPLAKARDDYFESEAGQSILRDSPTGQYLRNRIELAFLAGADAQRKITADNVAKSIERFVAELIQDQPPTA